MRKKIDKSAIDIILCDILYDILYDIFLVTLNIIISTVFTIVSFYLLKNILFLNERELSVITSVVLCFFIILIDILYKKFVSIPKKTIVIEKSKKEINIKWIGKYNFTIRKYIKDVKRSDFKYDRSGKIVPFIDVERIFVSVRKYKKEKHKNYLLKRKNYSKNINIENKAILKELTDDLQEVRKATDAEIKEIEKRFLINKLIAFCFFVVIMILAKLPPVFMICGILLIILLVLIFNCFNKIFKIKNVTYLIIECDILEKYNYNTSYRSSPHFIVRCSDKKKLYIDGWFECDVETYKNKMIKIVIAKQKDKKIYIDSFDSLWQKRPYIIKY